MDEPQDEPESETIVTTGVAEAPEGEAAVKTRQLPPFNVIILNDEEHSYGYVIDLLTRLFAHPVAAAIVLTERIDKTGRAVVYTTHKEKAELKCEQVLAYGADPAMSISKGPLGCYIEPA